jgi:hypothetical protein
MPSHCFPLSTTPLALPAIKINIFTVPILIGTTIMDHQLLLQPNHDDLPPPDLPASVSLATDESRPSAPDPNLNGLSAALLCYPYGTAAPAPPCA